MTARDFSDRDIHLALDGELPADELPAFEAWLEANPDMKARSQRYAADRALLQRAVAGVLAESVPARLTALAAGDVPPAARRSALWKVAAAAVAAFLVGGLGGYALGQSGWRPDSRMVAGRAIAEEAIEAHLIYAAEKLHVVEVGADQTEHLVGWLSRRVGVELVAPDLTGEGLEFLGGRLLPVTGGGKAAQFMYEDRGGNRISLYVAREPGASDTGFRFVEAGGASSYYWLDEGYGCAVTGSGDTQKLLAVANAAYRQLLSGQHA